MDKVSLYPRYQKMDLQSKMQYEQWCFILFKLRHSLHYVLQIFTENYIMLRVTVPVLKARLQDRVCLNVSANSLKNLSPAVAAHSDSAGIRPTAMTGFWVFERDCWHDYSTHGDGHFSVDVSKAPWDYLHTSKVHYITVGSGGALSLQDRVWC